MTKKRIALVTGGMGGLGVFGLLFLIWNRRLTAVIKLRRAAEKDLGDQLAFQHALIDSMPDPVFVRDLQGRLIMCNRSYEEALSIRLDQVLGKLLIEVDALMAENRVAAAVSKVGPLASPGERGQLVPNKARLKEVLAMVTLRPST